MKKIVFMLCLFYLTLTKLLGQDKMMVLGSSNFNSKTIGLYKEKIEKMGGKVLETFLSKDHSFIFVIYDENQIQPEKFAEKLSQNELGQPVYVKQVQSSDQLKELGVNSTKVFAYLEENTNQTHPKKESNFNSEPKEINKEGKRFVKCDWAPFYYEVTGNQEVDEINYQKAKEKWVNENPKEYQSINCKQTK